MLRKKEASATAPVEEYLASDEIKKLNLEEKEYYIAFRERKVPEYVKSKVSRSISSLISSPLYTYDGNSFDRLIQKTTEQGWHAGRRMLSTLSACEEDGDNVRRVVTNIYPNGMVRETIYVIQRQYCPRWVVSFDGQIKPIEAGDYQTIEKNH